MHVYIFFIPLYMHTYILCNAEAAGLQLHTLAGHMHMVYYSQSSIKHEAQRWKCFFTLVELRTACLHRKSFALLAANMDS